MKGSELVLSEVQDVFARESPQGFMTEARNDQRLRGCLQTSNYRGKRRKELRVERHQLDRFAGIVVDHAQKTDNAALSRGAGGEQVGDPYRAGIQSGSTTCNE